MLLSRFIDHCIVHRDNTEILRNVRKVPGGGLLSRFIDHCIVHRDNTEILRNVRKVPGGGHCIYSARLNHIILSPNL